LIKKLMLVLVGTGVSLFLCEGIIRVTLPQALYSSQNLIVPDSLAGTRFRPNAVGYIVAESEPIEIRTNRFGMRDDDVELLKPDRTFRILNLGDSFGAGHGVHQDSSYSELLEKQLNASLVPDLHVDVLNASVPGYDPRNEYLYYLHYGRAFTPDLVVLGLYVGNDFSTLPSAAVQNPASPPERPPAFALRRLTYGIRHFLGTHSHLYIFLRRTFDHLLDRWNLTRLFGNNLDIYERELSSHALARYDRNVSYLDSLRQQCAADSVPLILVVIPTIFQIDSSFLSSKIIDFYGLDESRFDWSKPQQRIHEHFDGQHGVAVIDMRDHLINPELRYYLPRDNHWNGTAHAVAADVLAKLIRTRYLP
jgi:hypothetical protein